MSTPDPESVSWLRFVIASVTVIGLMGLLSWGLKRVASRGWGNALSGSRQRRLKIVENMQIDARRRLVIVQCDNAEHLILLGVNQECVVAGNLPPSPNHTAP